MSLSLRPIVTICGTTGVGKSKLAIDLALRLNSPSPDSFWRGAKVINADSMQVYQGLDIMTNKVPLADRCGIEHLMMGFKKPGEQYVVGEWVQDTLKLEKIDELHENRQIPIVVGGTSYWIQHLIFPNRLVSQEHESPVEPVWSKELLESISKLPPDLLELFHSLPVEPPSAKQDPDAAFEMHNLLSKLDPIVAQRWHWRDTRKVLRSLEIIKSTKKKTSEIILEQSQNALDNNPRFRTLCFWLFAQSTFLIPRLDARVDDMLSQGLLDEVRELHDVAQRPPEDSTFDFTTGIYQSIGYREFYSYLSHPSPSIYDAAVERMKISTRQYAKRQVSWIRNKLIPAVKAANRKETLVPFYLLDASDAGNKWSENVENPAQEILSNWLHDQDLPDPASLSPIAAQMLMVQEKTIDPQGALAARQKRVCPTCTLDDDRPVMIEEGDEWELHRHTKAHRKLAAKAHPQTTESSGDNDNIV